MLISCRKEGDSLTIGEQIEIRIVSIRKNKVTLGVVAPRDIKIRTRKLSDMEMANTMAAAHSVYVGQLFGVPRDEAENIIFVLEANLLERSAQQTDKGSGGLDE